MKSLKNMITALVSRWWLIVLAAAVGAILTLAADQLTQTTTSEASARVGLTSVAEWPRFQSDLESFGNVVQRSDTVELVRETIGAETLEVNIVLVEGVFVSEIRTEAPTAELAVEAAAQFAQIGIREQAVLVDGARMEELAVFEAEYDAAVAEAAELLAIEEAAREDASAAGAAVDDGEFSFEAESVYREANASATSAEAASRNAAERVRSLENRISELRLVTDLPSARLFVIDDATAIADASRPFSGPFPVILAALAAALAVGGLVIARDRLHGPIRSSAQVEHILELPLLADMSGSDEPDGERLNQAVAKAGASNSVVLRKADDVDVDLQELREILEDLLSNGPSSTRHLAKLSTKVKDNSSGTVLVVQGGVTPMEKVRDEIQLARISGRELHGVVIV